MRLTEKYDTYYLTSGANIIETPDIIEGHKFAGEAIVKLGQLEDLMESYKIEDQGRLEDLISAGLVYERISKDIGIGLDILFKALKNGVYCKDEYGGEEKEFHDVRGIEENGLSVISNICKYPECDWTEYFKDYGKTWALTKGELE